MVCPQQQWPRLVGLQVSSRKALSLEVHPHSRRAAARTLQRPSSKLAFPSLVLHDPRLRRPPALPCRSSEHCPSAAISPMSMSRTPPFQSASLLSHSSFYLSLLRPLPESVPGCWCSNCMLLCLRFPIASSVLYPHSCNQFYCPLRTLSQCCWSRNCPHDTSVSNDITSMYITGYSAHSPFPLPLMDPSKTPPFHPARARSTGPRAHTTSPFGRYAHRVLKQPTHRLRETARGVHEHDRAAPQSAGPAQRKTPLPRGGLYGLLCVEPRRLMSKRETRFEVRLPLRGRGLRQWALWGAEVSEKKGRYMSTMSPMKETCYKSGLYYQNVIRVARWRERTHTWTEFLMMWRTFKTSIVRQERYRRLVFTSLSLEAGCSRPHAPGGDRA